MEPSQFGLPAGLDRTEAHRDYHNSMHNQFEGSILQGGQTFNFDGWVFSEPARCEDGLLTLPLIAVRMSRTDTFPSYLVPMGPRSIPDFESTSLNACPTLELTSSNKS